MSIAYAQGFENAVIATDLAVLGLFANTTNSANNRIGQATSAISTGQATSGRAYVYSNGLSISAYPGAAGSGDPGYLQFNKTVSQLWAAGGFVVGFSGKFNRWSGSAIIAGAQEFIGSGQYTARAINGSVYCMRVRPIAVNSNVVPQKWNTVTHNWDNLGALTTGGTGNSAYIRVFQLGTNEVGLLNFSSAGTFSSGVVQYSTDGVTYNNWSVAPGNTISMAGKSSGRTTDYYVFGNASASPTPSIYVGSTIGGAVTTVTLPATTSSTVLNTFIPITEGSMAGRVIVASSGPAYWFTNNNATNNLDVATTWAVYTAPAAIYDYYWSAPDNYYIVQTANGTYSQPNPGTTFTALQTAQPITQTVVFNGLRFGINTNGTAVSGNGQSILVSFDNGKSWSVAWAGLSGTTTGYSFSNIMTDGTYLYATISAVGMFRSSDGFTWTCVFSCEYGEQVTNTNYSPTGVMFTTQTNTSTHALNTSASTPAFGLTWAQTSSGATTRTANLRGPTLNAGSSNLSSFSVSAPISNSGASHFYEFEFTPTAVGNTFTFRLWIDGTLIYDSGTAGYLLATSTSDTTTYPFLNVGRSATMTGIDHVMLIVKDGVGTTGPTGGAAILPRRLTGDVAANWTRNPTNLTTNVSAVNAGSISSSNASTGTAVAARYVQTDTDAARDEYSSSDTVAAQGRVLGVMTEAVYTKVSGTQAVVNQGITYGGTDALTTQTITAAGAGYWQTINETAPGGGAWDTASADGCNFVQVKVS